MLKVGMVGCGDIARAHANAWQTIPDKAVITAVSDVVEASAGTMAEKVGGATAYTDFRQMIADADIDAIDVCLPHHLHRDAIVAGARAGKHVICEKPLCLSIDEAEEIGGAVRAAGVTMMCAHNQLFDSAVQRALTMVRDGALGKIFFARTCDCFRHTKPLSEWGWRAAAHTMGGGCLIDTGYHPSYLLLNLVGQEPTEVSAIGGRYFIHTLDGEDSALMTVKFADGAIGEVLTSWAWDWPDGSWQFQLIGEKGQLFGRGNKLLYKPIGWQPATLELKPTNTFAAELEHFADSIANGTQPLNTNVQGTQVLRLILGAYESMREKKIVSIA
ncbi:MAG TPA: Gfo/Idh/MocA family oxidoreductase [Chloroflexota bacterium]|nr:Gfo/Idh/MocA family oxidoreductase [Chloroflexota bacterium]